MLQHMAEVNKAKLPPGTLIDETEVQSTTLLFFTVYRCDCSVETYSSIVMSVGNPMQKKHCVL